MASAVTPTQATYDVWGGNVLDLNKSYYNVDKLGFTKLGSTNRSATFYGRYNYYVVAVRKTQTLYLDAAQTSSGGYYNNGSLATGNTGGTSSGAFGAPDNVYMVLKGPAAGSGTSTYGAYAIFYNTGGWTSMKFIVYEPQLSPAITAQPTKQVAPTGDTIRFKVSTIGKTPLGYQWFGQGASLANGGRISGANSSTLTISGLQAGDSGNYFVVITNAYGSITSAPAALSALPPTQASYDVWAGDVLDLNQHYYEVDRLPGYVKLGSTNRDATFFGKYKYYIVVARKTEVLFLDAVRTSAGTYYAGSLASGNTGGGVIGRASGPPDGRYLLLNGPGGGSASPYTYGSYAIFYNTGGWTSMTFLVYSPDIAPAIDSQPGGRIALSGSGVQFNVTTTGRLPLKYQWRKNGAKLVNGGKISGATSPTLTINKPSMVNAGEYSVVVQNLYGSITSSVAPLSVVVPPRNQMNSLASTATLTVQTAGGEPLTYQWRKNGLDLFDNGRITGTTTANLTISDLNFSDAGPYTVVVANGFDRVTNPAPAMLTVADRIAPSLAITSHAELQLIGSRTVTLSGTATDAGRGDNGIKSVTVKGLRANDDTVVGNGVAAWSKTLSLLNGTNRINVIAKDHFGNKTVNSFRLVCDTVKPVVKITSPRTGQRMSNAVFTVQGTARDKSSLTGIWCQLNSDDWLPVTPGPDSIHWATTVNLQPGTNMIRVYADDVVGNRSLTNTVKVTFVQAFSLADYWHPISVGNQWVYKRTHSAVTPANSVIRVESTAYPLTCYRGRTTPTPYVTNVISLYSSYCDFRNGIEDYVEDTWYEYYTVEGGVRIWGSDDDPGTVPDPNQERFRVHGGALFGTQLTVGGVFSSTRDFYEDGKFIGAIPVSIRLLSVTSVTVPAGTFQDCLHLRITHSIGGKVDSFEEWWAKGVGMVKKQRTDSGGDPELYELLEFSLVGQPAPIAQKATGTQNTLPEPVTAPEQPPQVELSVSVAPVSDGYIHLRLDVPNETLIVLEASPDLQHWTAIQTNTVTADGKNLSVPINPAQAGWFFRAVKP